MLIHVKKVCVPFFAAVAAALLLGACASGSVVTRDAGQSLEAAQAEPGLGGKYRVMVGAIVDKTDPLKEESLGRQLDTLNAGRDDPARLTGSGLLHALQDLLVTELFGSERFIVLERAALDAVITEQEFAASARAGEATRIPKAQLEGAELIVLGALTAFDAGASGGALPIPVPLGDRGDFGLMHLRLKRGYVAMDLRVIDARTGRVLSVVAVQGRNTRFGLNFDLFLRGSSHRARLPGVLTYFQNTPVEKALQEMVTVAVGHIAERVPAAPPLD
jgi:curli biogenesis system outer membrane secretion channel CsgG